MLEYLALCCFVLSIASLYTIAAYSITNSPWASTFFTAATGLLFLLENIELQKKVREGEEEIEYLKKSTHLTLTPRFNDMQAEITQLKAQIDRNRRLKKHSKSCSDIA